MDTEKVREAVEIIRQAKQELAEIAFEYLRRDNAFWSAEEYELAEKNYENTRSYLDNYTIGGRLFISRKPMRFKDNFSVNFKENDIEIQLSFHFDNEWDTYIYSITCEESGIYQYVPPINGDCDTMRTTLTIGYWCSDYEKEFKVVSLLQ